MWRRLPERLMATASTSSSSSSSSSSSLRIGSLPQPQRWWFAACFPRQQSQVHQYQYHDTNNHAPPFTFGNKRSFYWWRGGGGAGATASTNNETSSIHSPTPAAATPTWADATVDWSVKYPYAKTMMTTIDASSSSSRRSTSSNDKSKFQTRTVLHAPLENIHNNATTTYKDYFTVSVCSVRGWRTHMEDAFLVTSDVGACFDGHGGMAVSRYLRQNLYANLQTALVQQQQSSSLSTLASAAFLSSSSQPRRISSLAPDATERKVSSDVATHGVACQTGSTQSEPSIAANGRDSVSQQQPSVNDFVAALELALDKVDREVQCINHWSYQGSTAVVCWFHSATSIDDSKATAKCTSNETFTTTVSDREVFSNAREHDLASSSLPQLQQQQNRAQRTLITANVGDSRAVLCRKGNALELTRDHKPDLPSELERIHNVGGRVVWDGLTSYLGTPIPGTGGWRVNNRLAMSRAIGDRAERPAVSGASEISVVQLTDDDEFLILATDGLWDVMSSSETVAYIRSLLESIMEHDGEVAERDAIAAMVVEEALRRGSGDNITVVIIWMQTSLPKPKKTYWI